MINDAFMRLHGTSANPPVPAAPVALTGANTTTTTYYMDLSSPTNASGGLTTSQFRDIGEGRPLYAVVTIVQAFSATTSAKFDVITSTGTAGTANVVSLGTTGVVLLANLTAGTQFVFPLAPAIGSKGQQYLMGQVTLGANDMVNGTFFMDIVADYADSKKFYAGGFVVS